MKKTSPLGLLGIAAVWTGLVVSPAWASQASIQVASASAQQVADQDSAGAKTTQELDISFVGKNGFEQVRSKDIESWFDDGWYQSEQFPGMSTDSVFFPDAQMSPLERATLLFDYLEGQLPHARYRIQMGTDFSTVGQPGQGPMAFVEVTRFNLGPALHEDLQTQYDQVADLEEFGVGPHVSRRFIFTPIQGMNAHVVAAGRQELSDEQAADMMCFEQSCLVMDEIAGKSGDWEEVEVPAGVAQAQGGSATEQADDTQNIEVAVNDSVAEVVGELALAHIGAEYGEPVESVQAPDPYLEIVVSKDVTGQAPVLDVISHQGHLMDDALSDIWYRRIQVDGTDPHWERLLQHRRPMGH